MAQDDNDQTQGSQGAETTEGGGALDLQSTLDYALEMVQEQARSHPVRTLGIAMGVGYVLGGGVPKFMVRLGLLAAGRIMTDAIATEGMRSLASMAQGQTEGEGEGERAQPQGRSKNGHHRKRGQGGERQARRE